MPARALPNLALTNPLLGWRARGFPDFEAMRPEHLAPAFGALEKEARAAARLASREDAPLSWSARYGRVAAAWTRFDDAYRVALAAAMLHEERLGGWEEEAMRRWDELNGWLSRHRGLARALRALREKPGLPAWQREVLKGERFGGWARESAQERERKVEIDRRIHKLGLAYDLNVRMSMAEATVGFSERSQTQGARAALLGAARARAKESGEGGWLFCAEDAEYATFMAECENRESRRMMYRARVQAASELAGGGRDNTPLARGLLRLRKEKAGLFKKPDFAAHRLAGNMLKSAKEAEAFLLELAEGVLPKARQERRELFEWARDHEGARRLEPWDQDRARAALFEERFGDCESKAMAYLAVSGAIERSVAAAAALMRCQARRDRRLEGGANLMVFKIEREGERVGTLGVSPFATSDRRAGGMYEWDLSGALRGEAGGASAMVFMQMPKAARMGHLELTRLFHELGHAFHALLSRPRCAEHAAAGLEWDAIEAHSQLFEQLAWEPSVLKAVGRRKGKAMPAKLIESLRSARNFHSASEVLRRASEALADLRLHSAFNPRGRKKPWEELGLAREAVGLERLRGYNREGNHGSHFGTLSSAYASVGHVYLWSEALAISIFERWRQESGGRLTHKKAAERLERLLFSPGSSQPMSAMFRRHTEQNPPALDALYKTRELKT